MLEKESIPAESCLGMIRSHSNHGNVISTWRSGRLGHVLPLGVMTCPPALDH